MQRGQTSALKPKWESTASYCAMKTAIYLCSNKVLKQAQDATSFHVEIKQSNGSGDKRVPAAFLLEFGPPEVASAQTALWGERSSADQWTPKNIHSLLLAQLSISLFYLHYIHLSAPFISSYIYLIIFFLCFFDSLSISLPSSLSLKRRPAVINVLLPGMV